jgi:hypothetical protein
LPGLPRSPLACTHSSQIDCTGQSQGKAEGGPKAQNCDEDKIRFIDTNDTFGPYDLVD